MATTYRLYFYTRALQDGDAVSSSDWGILRHGAYYLVKETEENGEKSYEATLIDLDVSNDQITFHITPTQDVKLYTFADGEKHYFMTSMRDGQDVTEDFLEGHDARCNQIMSGEAAKNAFEKIRLDAELREVLYQGHQGIDYGIILRNCIGWSTYMSNMFLGGTDIYQGTGWNNWHNGWYLNLLASDADKAKNDILDTFNYLISSPEIVISRDMAGMPSWIMNEGSYSLSYTLNGQDYLITDGQGVVNDASDTVILGIKTEQILTNNGSDVSIYTNSENDRITNSGDNVTIETGKGVDRVISTGNGAFVVAA